MIKKIVTIGPESTGKSTLCKELASYFDTVWCPEYARDYLLNNGKEYSYEDLLNIAKGQIAIENEHLSKLETYAEPALERGERIPYFIDTDMHVMKVWSQYVFGKCHSFIEEQLASSQYDLYLLCNIDLPWVKDELREYPDVETRRILYLKYKRILEEQSTPWVIISGTEKERFNRAVQAVSKLL